VIVCVCVCVCAAVDNVLQRMTIVGVLLSFRCLAQEALLDVCFYYPPICSMERYIVCCVFIPFLSGDRYLRERAADWHEILRASRAMILTILLPFWW